MMGFSLRAVLRVKLNSHSAQRQTIIEQVRSEIVLRDLKKNTSIKVYVLGGGVAPRAQVLG